MAREQSIRAALERLARSSWGEQGIGFCPTSRLRKSLSESGFAKQVDGERPGIMALTLKGFRELEKRRVDQQIFGHKRRRR